MIEVNLPIPPEQLDACEEFLLEFGETRWMLTQDLPTATAKLLGVFDVNEAAQAAFAELSAANPLFAGATAEFRVLADEDWRNSYKAHFKAWQFGHLHWVPIWEKGHYPLSPGDQVIWLDPGLAFGTGNHETTRLCCERLVSLTDRGRDRTNVIDAGCGSGILALSAVALGFSDVVGFDNDPVAVRISEENAAQNPAAHSVNFFVGDLITGLAARTADIVLANIQADVLTKFADLLVGAVKPGGALILSGILAQENSNVKERFQAVAPDWSCESKRLGEWSDLLLQRPSTDQRVTQPI